MIKVQALKMRMFIQKLNTCSVKIAKLNFFYVFVPEVTESALSSDLNLNSYFLFVLKVGIVSRSRNQLVKKWAVQIL